MTKKRLGRGLDALLSQSTSSSAIRAPAASDQGELAIESIHRSKYQPRRQFDQSALEELAASIKAQGLMQPVVVRLRPQGGYELIAGERRWRAAQLAGLGMLPAIIKNVSDKQASAMALIENIQREDLNPLEEALALDRLRNEYELTQQQVADAVGKSRVAVTNLLRLLNLAPRVRDMLAIGELEMGHARALLTLDAHRQEQAALKVIDRQLSVRQTEALVRQLQNPMPAREARPQKSADTRRLEQDLTERVGAPVSIDHNAAGKGQVVIRYTTLDELEGVLAHLN